ncbi:HAD family hydrolase [Luteolibacter sp. SL250]|uniref:HAD family hydrolase n=1 Tax=Luteolibacter sp. SL250 TaxID=2995170 RepID=UPI00226F176B|nr:HAD family hydrolase [Luteolibacter sp. SL250]WAC21079.1 HAD family hydrolase [Luteolibacter sp. SL250]
MRIAIVHYHLSPGGVTTIIRAACRGLAAAGVHHLVLCGNAPAEDLPVRIVPDLRYLRTSARPAEALLEEMRKAAADALGGPPDVWHFHNHSLGKNILMPRVVSLLAEAGERLVLQLHDLVEDGRPGNHPLVAEQPWLYPLSPRVRYAFINGTDHHRFLAAGLPEENAILLPNPIPTAPPLPPAPQEKPPLILYPTRAIRRKNLGELLLLSMFAPEGTRFAITRAPEDPAARAIHDHWKWLAEELELPVQFGVVDRTVPHGENDASYASWIAASTHFITTSVAEGFGMIFPEAAAFGKPVIGRELETHPRSGDRPIYQNILVPEEWMPAGYLRRHLSRHLGETHRLYKRRLAPEDTDSARAALLHDGHVDFGNLPETLQREILLRLRGDPSLRPIIGGKPADEWMREALAQPPAPYTGQGIPEGEYGRKLISYYASLSGRAPGAVGYADPERVLDAYLSPENFHFLRTSIAKIRAVIFDIYGTLLIAPPGAVKHDPAFDPALREILSAAGHDLGDSPTAVLHAAVRRHHAESGHAHPEIDLMQVWQEVLGTTEDVTDLITAVENAWHPCEPMPRARETLQRLSAEGVTLGVLSNAQANTLPALDGTLGAVTHLLVPELTLLSYQHGLAKPSPELFQLLVRRLEACGISPAETLFVGNDPRQDILPAQAAGFRTALFAGHSGSLRPGECTPDLTLRSLSEIPSATSSF